MNCFKPVFLVIIVSIFCTAVAIANLASPTDTHAHPAYGFTPQPPPSDGDDTGDEGGGSNGGGGGGGDNGTDESIPPHYILVELDRCDLSCAFDYGGARVGQAAAQPPAPEVQVRVQLVHRGSGWIADGIISDVNSTRLSVPYPGQWDVFMIAEPKFVTAAAVDIGSLNLDQLSAGLADGPVSLGMVEANTAEPQLVECPIECVIDLPPPTLPVTGQDRSTSLLIIFLNSAFLLILGLSMSLQVSRTRS